MNFMNLIPRANINPLREFVFNQWFADSFLGSNCLKQPGKVIAELLQFLLATHDARSELLH